MQVLSIIQFLFAALSNAYYIAAKAYCITAMCKTKGSCCIFMQECAAGGRKNGKPSDGQ